MTMTHTTSQQAAKPEIYEFQQRLQRYQFQNWSSYQLATYLLEMNLQSNSYLKLKTFTETCRRQRVCPYTIVTTLCHITGNGLQNAMTLRYLMLLIDESIRPVDPAYQLPYGYFYALNQSDYYQAECLTQIIQFKLLSHESLEQLSAHIDRYFIALPRFQPLIIELLDAKYTTRSAMTTTHFFPGLQQRSLETKQLITAYLTAKQWSSRKISFQSLEQIAELLAYSCCDRVLSKSEFMELYHLASTITSVSSVV
jgi:hypothetical protein